MMFVPVEEKLNAGLERQCRRNSCWEVKTPQMSGNVTGFTPKRKNRVPVVQFRETENKIRAGGHNFNFFCVDEFWI